MDPLIPLIRAENTERIQICSASSGSWLCAVRCEALQDLCLVDLEAQILQAHLSVEKKQPLGEIYAESGCAIIAQFTSSLENLNPIACFQMFETESCHRMLPLENIGRRSARAFGLFF